MTDIIEKLTQRIEKYRKTNKNPCKNYATKLNAQKATSEAAQIVANEFYLGSDDAEPARYVVFYNEAWGRWVGAIDMTEVLSRETSTGGYVGVAEGFYKY